jgi:repressor LexA
MVSVGRTASRKGVMNRVATPFTPKQGQYLAFIYAYTRLNRRPPAEADIERHFQVSPPSVHQMVLTLERRGFIRRQPGVARSIELLVDPETLPTLL